MPFTPATGRRLLTGPGPPVPALVAALAAGIKAVAEASKAWSIHLLFTTEAERSLLTTHGFQPRTTHQFHWHNKGYSDFDDWLSRFRSKDRKNARRERRRAQAGVDRILTVPGAAATPAQWRTVRDFYQDTCSRKWGQAYLTDAFFELLGTHLGHRSLLLLAEKDGQTVASALMFRKGAHLYGRYWGCRPGFPDLHFELCYHRPIALCIERGWRLFEAGAQGNHKLKRGLMPALTCSSHWLRHPGLSDAVGDALHREDRAVRQQVVVMAEHGPFKQEVG